MEEVRERWWRRLGRRELGGKSEEEEKTGGGILKQGCVSVDILDNTRPIK